MLTSKETVFHLCTTPEELRKLADEMEAKIAKMTIGDSVVTHSFPGDSNDFRLAIVYNQGE